nr:MAG TPA: hypothetical protein [Caudoviricetes sp.]
MAHISKIQVGHYLKFINKFSRKNRLLHKTFLLRSLRGSVPASWRFYRKIRKRY